MCEQRVFVWQGEHVADLMLGSQPCPTVEEYRRNMADLVTRGVQGLTQIQNVRDPFP